MKQATRYLLFFSMIAFWGINTNQSSAQIPESIPASVLDFYDASLQLHERAPKETAQFGQLMGIWHCEQFNLDNDSQELKLHSTAFWAWKYILDGYGVQDLWYQGENESPFWKYFKRDLMLTQIRIFDTKEKMWKVAFINNHAGEVPGRMFGLFTAHGDGDDIVMEFLPKDDTNMRRILFTDIKEGSFAWRVEQSENQGQTWKVTSKISAKRVK